MMAKSHLEEWEAAHEIESPAEMEKSFICEITANEYIALQRQMDELLAKQRTFKSALLMAIGKISSTHESIGWEESEIVRAVGAIKEEMDELRSVFEGAYAET